MKEHFGASLHPLHPVLLFFTTRIASVTHISDLCLKKRLSFLWDLQRHLTVDRVLCEAPVAHLNANCTAGALFIVSFSPQKISSNPTNCLWDLHLSCSIVTRCSCAALCLSSGYRGQKGERGQPGVGLPGDPGHMGPPGRFQDVHEEVAVLQSLCIKRKKRAHFIVLLCLVLLWQ